MVDIGLERERIHRTAIERERVYAELHQFTLRIVNIISHLNGLLEIKVVSHDNVQLQLRKLTRRVGLKHDIEVANRQTALRKEVAVLKLLELGLKYILLQLRRVATTHTHQNLVHALTQEARHHKVGGRVGVINLGYELVVDIECICRAVILDVEEEVVVVHRSVNLKLLHKARRAIDNIYAHGRKVQITSRFATLVSHGVLALVVCDKLAAIDTRRLRHSTYNRKEGHAQQY